MDTDQNLLFGVLALQADLISSQQFIEVCTLWAVHKTTPLADLLLERGWILPDDRGHVEYLLDRKLKKHGGDGRAGLASIPDDIKRSLAAVGDAGIRCSLADLPRLDGSTVAATVDFVPESPQRYKLIRLHATGGIGRVWVAHDNTLGRNVALKELQPDKTKSPTIRARFLNEAMITGRLEHPGIVPLYELARQTSEQQPFYTMRFVKGRTLTEAICTYHQKRTAGQEDSLGLLGLLNAFVTVCQTVAYAHANGIIHRDLKGQNVVLGDFGEVVVLDWGLAKVLNHPDIDAGSAPLGRDRDELGEVDLTMQGQALGTPAYMAPEQADGQRDLIDARTDVYGLGAILYEILTGRPPFSGATIGEVLRKVREEKPESPSQLCADIPETLEAICLRALAKHPTERFAAAGELAQQVQLWLAELAERKQAEYQRSRFFALSLDLMVIAGFDGYFKQLNPAWEKTLGWTVEELQAKPWSEFVHPDDLARTLASTQSIVAGDALHCLENRYRCKDGSFRWLQWTAQEIVGQQLIYAMARDITERTR